MSLKSVVYSTVKQHISVQSTFQVLDNTIVVAVLDSVGINMVVLKCDSGTSSISINTEFG